MSGSKARLEYKEELPVTYPFAMTRGEYLSLLNIDQPPTVVRGTGIICTIGPSSQEVSVLEELIANGLNIARINFSHGSYEYHQKTIDNIRIAAKTIFPHVVGLALDTKGAEIRTGNTKNGGEVTYVKGQELKVTSDPYFKNQCSESLLFLDYPDLIHSVKCGSKIVIADGNFLLEVKEIIDNNNLLAVVLNDATIGSRKNCNLPGAVIALPAVSEKDKQDLLFGVKNKVDMVFASFIRKASDVAEVRNALGEEGKSIKVIAKIENYEGVVNIDEIITAADGIMVARGDMGMEMPAEKVFLAQKILITRCNRAGKPVICATQMLESMIKNPRPTRAEITDVGNAVVDGADCVMLSGETANGAYPIEAVAVMHKICRQAATVQFYKESFSEHLSKNYVTNATETTCIAAVAASFKALASAIIVLTTSGRTSWIMSKYRPQCPIIVITRNEQVARLCHLYRGLFPLVYSTPRIKAWHEDMFDRLEFAITYGKDMGFIKTGSSVVFVSGCQPGTNSTNTVQIIQVDEKPISGIRYNTNFCLI
ncbi:pyruvate kinase PKM isoform X1 [Hydra vulgaris]|uniref:pyruvate kinase PKM isoform X1 n=1 Tax=Hydra vulgaris TaxID=6087 RepID=UPI001F5F06A7|nr:pyruvate kinase PKM isoform X1 [Hydra vulgaris]